MKKTGLLSLFVFILGLTAIPAMAAWEWEGPKYEDFRFSGEYYVEGILNSNETLNDNDANSQYRQMRLRVRTDFKITENLRLTTRFDALDKVWSSKDTGQGSKDAEGYFNDTDDNIDFDRAYMSIKSPIGLFVLGRQKGVTWGTTWADDEDDTDRFKYVLPIPDTGFIIGFVAEKVTEADRGPGVSDGDNDKWYLAGIYKAEKFNCGVLTALYNFKRFFDPQQRFALQEVIDKKAELDENASTLMLTINASNYAYEQYTQGAADARAQAAYYQGLADQATMAAGGFSQFIAQAGADTSLETVKVAVPDLATACDSAIEAGYTTAGQAQAYFTESASQAQYGADQYTAGADSAEASAASYQAAAQASTEQLANMTSDLKAANEAWTALGQYTEAKVYLVAPYFTGKFGNLSIQSELDYIFGTLDYDVPGKEDKDAKAFSYFMEGRYDVGPFTFEAGYAYVTGDSDYTDNNVESMGYVAPGVDWDKMFILNSEDHNMNTTLGNGIGNHVGDGFATPSVCMLDGYGMFYMGVDYRLFEDALTLTCRLAKSTADDVPSGVDDDQGIEYDLRLKWKLMGNLEYEAIAAYLDAGDYWKDRGNIPDGDFEDTYALFHRLTLTF